MAPVPKPDGTNAATIPPLCKYSQSDANSGKGSCKTDIGWIMASYGLYGIGNLDTATTRYLNYVLRFRLNEACYLSTVVRSLQVPKHPAGCGTALDL
jgi:hypothetical protein